MNFIQTYWSLPAQEKTTDSLDRHNGGWVAEKFHAMSWAYSLMSLKKQHPDNKFKLYTDLAGAEWLVNRLGLPYDEVILSAEKLASYPPRLWALAKVQTYSLQTEPFVHVDGDVYIWKPFPQELLGKQLLAQHIELENPMYWRMLNESRTYLKNTPAFYDSCKTPSDIYAFGAGIFGGNDIELIKSYCEKCFEYVDTNLEIFRKADDPGIYNMFFEQSFIANMAKEKYGNWDDVGFVYNENEVTIYHMTRFTMVPRYLYFMHMCGTSKWNLSLLNHLEQRFQYDFPEMSQKIQQLYPASEHYYFNQRRENKVSSDAEVLYHTNRSLNKLLKKDKSSTNVVGAEVIEEILSENINNSDFYDVWDLYHIESTYKKLLDSQQTEHSPEWDLLYDPNAPDFLEKSFSLNWNNCEIVYLYGDWKVEVDKKKQKLSVEKQVPLEINVVLSDDEETPQPYLLSSQFGAIDITPVTGWNKLFHFFDEERSLSGNQIIEKLGTLENFRFDPATIRENIYFFLSTQYFIYNRLLPNGNHE